MCHSTHVSGLFHYRGCLLVSVRYKCELDRNEVLHGRGSRRKMLKHTRVLSLAILLNMDVYLNASYKLE